jgi:hypothetical protein
MGTPGSPPTRLTAIPDKWVRPTRRPADLSVGSTDLVGGPHDLLKTFQKIPHTTRKVIISDDLLVMLLTLVIEWYVFHDEMSIFVISCE